MLAFKFLSTLALPFLSMMVPSASASAIVPRQLVQADICANVDLNLPLKVNLVVINLDLSVDLGSLCLCTNAGVLTPSSVAQIDYAIRNNGGLLGALGSLVNSLLGTVANILNPVGQALGLTSINNAAATCVYPSDLTTYTKSSVCGDTCGFTCTGTLVKQGTECLVAVPQVSVLNRRAARPAWIKSRQAVVKRNQSAAKVVRSA